VCLYFDEILLHGDKNKTNVTHTYVLFEKNGKKSFDFEDFYFEIVRFKLVG